MKLHASTGSKMCATLFLMMLPFHTLFALAQKPEINVTIFRDLVRFAAPAETQDTHIEIFSSTGEKIFDGNFAAGQTQDWPMQNLQGQPVDSGVYTYTVTAKDQGGVLKQVQRGNVIIDREREGLEAAPPSDHSDGRSPGSTQLQPAGSWNIDHGKIPYSINAPAVGVGTQNPLARLQIGGGAAQPMTKGSTLLLEDGAATGMVLKSTTGGEMFFSQDKKLGLFGTASDHPLGIRTNNQNRLWITGEGNVGIGMTNPASRLTVAGMIETTSGGIRFPDGTIQTTAANGLTTSGDDVTGGTGGDPRRKRGVQPAGLGTDPWLMGGNSVSSGNFLGATNSQPLFFRTNNIDRMQVASNGYVGIGTAAAPAQLLELSGGSEPMLRITNTGMSGVPFLDIGMNAGNNAAMFQVTNGKDFKFYNGQYALTIAGANGNVGIGLTNPSRKLEVAGTSGNVFWAGASTGSTANIDLSGHVQLREFSNGGIAYLQARDDASNRNIALRLRTQKAGAVSPSLIEAVTIDANGNFGIGTTSPQQILDVSGGSGARVRINSSTNSGVLLSLGNTAEWSIATVKTNDDVCTRYFAIYDERTARNALTLDCTRTLTTDNAIVAGGAVVPRSDNSFSLGGSSSRWTAVWAVNGSVQTSDERLKKDVTNLGYGLSKVMQLRPVTFRWKDGKEDSRVRIGLIAQETEKIIPEVVERGDDSNSTMGMNYANLIPVLIKAIQEQQAGLDNRDARIGALEAENSSHQKRITELEDKLVMLDGRILAFEQMLQSSTASASATRPKLVGVASTNPSPITSK